MHPQPSGNAVVGCHKLGIDDFVAADTTSLMTMDDRYGTLVKETDIIAKYAQNAEKNPKKIKNAEKIIANADKITIFQQICHQWTTLSTT